MRRIVIVLGMVWLVGGAAAVQAAEKVFAFSTMSSGEQPEGFRSFVVGDGGPADWRIVFEDVPPLLAPLTSKAAQASRRAVLGQLSRKPLPNRFLLCLYQGEVFGDFKLETRFKIKDGILEQMAGIAFRVRDTNNYYYIRANAKDGNLYFFKVVGGQLIGPIGSRMPIERGRWYDFALQCRGNDIRCWLDGKEAFPTLHDATFLKGQLGFWTKSDSVCVFADTRVVYTPEVRYAQRLVNELLERYPRLLGLRLYARTNAQAEPTLIAGRESKSVGAPAPATARAVLQQNLPYFRKRGRQATVIMPVHDRNGDVVAAVEVVMKSFLGQTEKNAFTRAMPIVKHIESRVRDLKDLLD